MSSYSYIQLWSPLESWVNNTLLAYSVNIMYYKSWTINRIVLEVDASEVYLIIKSMTAAACV